MKTTNTIKSVKTFPLFLGILLTGLLLLSACQLSMQTFTAPDTADTGTVITLSFEGVAMDIGDEASAHGLVLQIPDNWTVLSAKANVSGLPLSLTESPAYESLYTAEAGCKVWVGTSTNSGEGNRLVTGTVKVLVGEFAGSVGDVQSFNLKAMAGVYRDGAWTTDDPEGVFDFAAITGEPYVEEIQVTKVLDDTAPAAITTLTIEDSGDGQAGLFWGEYYEAGQGDVVQYNIYQDTVAFTDVSAMTPVTTLPCGTFAEIISLPYGVEYFFAVTAVDELGNENQAVIPQSIILQEFGAILGRVVDEVGNPLEGIRISAYECTFNSFVADTWTRGDGSYDLFLSAGTYRLKADGGENYATEYYDDQCYSQDADMVTVDSQPVAGKDFVLPSQCKGNFDQDLDVDGSDLAVFAADFGRTDCPCVDLGSGIIFSAASTDLQDLQNLQDEILGLRAELAAKEKRFEELVSSYAQ